MDVVEERTYTVGELNRLIRQALSRRFPDEIWVEGELRGLTRASSGHVYFELADPSPDGRQTDAVLQVALFRTDKDAVNRILRRAGAVRMADGVHIRVRGTLDYFPPQGRLQLRMQGIDPEYTLGRLEAERRRLLAALTTEGLLDRNHALPYPALALRVGLVTSHGSAAQADFLHELGSSELAWQVTCVHTSVQGPGAELEVVAALRTLERAGVEVIALVRGGGARTDLATFDGELVARAIAGLAIPVVTGIGHETDQAVADLVAARSAKTPTACAATLVEDARAALGRAVRTWEAIAVRSAGDLAAADLHLDRLARRTSHAALRRLDRQDDRLDLARRRTTTAARGRPDEAVVALDQRRSTIAAPAAARHVDRASAASDDRRRRLVTAAPRAIRRRGAELDARTARVRAADPARLLARGWSITRTAAGDPVMSVAGLRAGHVLVTTLADGSVQTTVTSTEPAPTPPPDRTSTDEVAT